MQVMNPNGFEKGQGESDSDYSVRLKTVADELNSKLGESKQETQKWKKMAIGAFIAAALLFLFSVFLLCDNLGDRKEAKVAHKVELKKLQDEVDQLKLAAQKVPKVETFGVSASEVEKIVGEKCVGKEVPVVQKAPPKKAPKKGGNVADSRKPVSDQKEAVLSPPPAGGAFWGWVHPEATAANKRGCYADRLISGMPSQCSAIQVEPRVGAESEKQWNARVAAKNGIAVGVKDGKGTISSTTFSHVQVK